MILGTLRPSREIRIDHVVDIRNSSSNTDLIRILSETLRGAVYGSVKNLPRFPRNLDAFTEYAEDWYRTNLGQSKIVRIVGFEKLTSDLQREFLSVACSLHDAECNVLEEKLLGGHREVRDMLEELVIILS